MTKRAAGLVLRRWLGWLWRGADRDVRPAHIPQEAWNRALIKDCLGDAPGDASPRRLALLAAICRYRRPCDAPPLLVGAAPRTGTGVAPHR